MGNHATRARGRRGQPRLDHGAKWRGDAAGDKTPVSNRDNCVATPFASSPLPMT